MGCRARLRPRRVGGALAALAVALAVLGGVALGGGRGAAAGTTAAPIAEPLTAAAVAAAFAAAGLPVVELRQQPVGQGGPSGPPLVEREAWNFGVPGLAPSGGRILIFDEGEKLNKKVAWYKRAGADAAVLAHRNVILWLDPALDKQEAARYRRALQGLK